MEVEGKDLPRLARRWEREGWGKEDFGEAAKKRMRPLGRYHVAKGYGIFTLLLQDTKANRSP